MWTWWPESYCASTAALAAPRSHARPGRESVLSGTQRREFVDLARVLRCRVLLDEPMSRHTTFGIGGPADVLIYPETEEDLRRAIDWFRERSIPFKVIGNGSNLLVGDGGVRGGVIKLTRAFKQISFSGNVMLVGAGAKLACVIAAAAEHGLSGLESMMGIPGTIGGALVMNAGTDVGTIGDLVSEAWLMHDSGETRIWRARELGYGYRQSALSDSRMVVIGAALTLRPADRVDIYAKMNRLREKRASRQPLRHRSAGSVFRNPPEIAAAKLLDRAGAKGMRVGGAEVSRKHANFIVNREHATARDVCELIERLQRLALTTYGIALRTEIEIIEET